MKIETKNLLYFNAMFTGAVFMFYMLLDTISTPSEASSELSIYTMYGFAIFIFLYIIIIIFLYMESIINPRVKIKY